MCGRSGARDVDGSVRRQRCSSQQAAQVHPRDVRPNSRLAAVPSTVPPPEYNISCLIADDLPTVNGSAASAGTVTQLAELSL